MIHLNGQWMDASETCTPPIIEIYDSLVATDVCHFTQFVFISSTGSSSSDNVIESSDPVTSDQRDSSSDDDDGMIYVAIGLVVLAVVCILICIFCGNTQKEDRDKTLIDLDIGGNGQPLEDLIIDATHAQSQATDPDKIDEVGDEEIHTFTQWYHPLAYPFSQSPVNKTNVREGEGWERQSKVFLQAYDLADASDQERDEKERQRMSEMSIATTLDSPPCNTNAVKV